MVIILNIVNFMAALAGIGAVFSACLLMKLLLDDIRSCAVCADVLPLGANPVVSASPRSKIAIVGQAPGTAVHRSGVPWDDPSGVRLRDWLQVDREVFYDPDVFALVPMGFCYPGRGSSGDLPPRAECAPLWHEKLFSGMNHLQLILLVGSYAQGYYLGERKKRTLTETVQAFDTYLPKFLPLPHPSGRNNIWLKRNPWFEERVIPKMRDLVGDALKR